MPRKRTGEGWHRGTTMVHRFRGTWSNKTVTRRRLVAEWAAGSSKSNITSMYCVEIRSNGRGKDGFYSMPQDWAGFDLVLGLLLDAAEPGSRVPDQRPLLSWCVERTASPVDVIVEPGRGAQPVRAQFHLGPARSGPGHDGPQAVTLKYRKRAQDSKEQHRTCHGSVRRISSAFFSGEFSGAPTIVRTTPCRCIRRYRKRFA